MKIIELLNKIANGEEVPMFKYEGKVYKYNKNNEWFDELYSDGNCKSEIYFCELNDEIEMFTPTLNNLREYIGLARKEEKKIPEKLSTWFSVETKQSKELNIEYANVNFENMYEKINEICDYLKSKGDE